MRNPPTHRSSFELNGFVIVNGVLAETDIDELLIELDSERLGRAGARNLMSNKSVAALANDAKLVGLASEIAGKKMQPYKATLFAKMGKANWLVAWHQDTALPIEAAPYDRGWGSGSIKEGITFSHAPAEALFKIVALRLHLDNSTELNGPLRVIPGSHLKRHTEDEQKSWVGENVVTCCAEKGGVIAMSPLLIHASSKCVSDDPRRVLHIEYAPGREILNGVRLAVA